MVGLHTLQAFVDRIPFWLRYTLLLYLASRIAFTFIGIISYETIGHHDIGQFPTWLEMWKVWDSSWYIGIAEHGYSTMVNHSGMANYAYFPLYPFFMKVVGLATGDYYVAGLIISNICIFISCFYLYRLVRLDNDEGTALRAIKYLFLFPTAFILSAALSESLFLALSIASIYYARKGIWLNAGALGLLTALTRPYGLLILLPLAYEYMERIDWEVLRVRAEALYLLMVPAGILIYGLFNYFLAGDPLAFMNVQAKWGARLVNPLEELATRVSTETMSVRFGGYMTLTAVATLLLFHRRVRPSLFIYGLALIVVPLSTASSFSSMARYILVVFPLFLILSSLARSRGFDQVATIGLAMVQGFLMAIWVTWMNYIV